MHTYAPTKTQETPTETDTIAPTNEPSVTPNASEFTQTIYHLQMNQLLHHMQVHL